MREGQEETTRRRVEYRVVCLNEDGTELVWKYTEILGNALHYLKTLDPKYRVSRKCLIYEVQVIEIIRTVYTLDAQTTQEEDNSEGD
jgi:hypothetical protein